MCSLSFSAGLNEPGSLAWALPLAANATLLPSPEQLLGVADASQFFVAGQTPKGAAHIPAAAVVSNATVVSLASQAAYTLVLSARDAAPAPNHIASVVTLQLTAPDVRPPAFTGEPQPLAGEGCLPGVAYKPHDLISWALNSSKKLLYTGCTRGCFCMS